MTTQIDSEYVSQQDERARLQKGLPSPFVVVQAEKELIEGFGYSWTIGDEYDRNNPVTTTVSSRTARKLRVRGFKRVLWNGDVLWVRKSGPQGRSYADEENLNEDLYHDLLHVRQLERDDDDSGDSEYERDECEGEDYEE